MTGERDALSQPGPSAMRLRLELFVEDLERSARWYVDVLGFQRIRGDADYVSVRRGHVVLGLGPVEKLPSAAASTAGRPDQQVGHTQQRVRRGPGAGVEIVLEVDDVTAVDAAAQRVADHGWPLAAPLTDRAWGLRDFRVVDPDGYYLRVTHGDATSEGAG